MKQTDTSLFVALAVMSYACLKASGRQLVSQSVGKTATIKKFKFCSNILKAFLAAL